MSSRGITLAGSLLFLFIGSLQAQDSRKEQVVRGIESTSGPVLYKEHCAVCHGIDGRGYGPMARYLKVAPSDLTTLTARNNAKYPIARVQRLISGEEELPAGHGNRLMPVWGQIFSQVAWDQDLGRVRVYNLAKYLETLQK